MAILNTRPDHQCTKLTQLLESKGERVIHLPVIRIEALPDAFTFSFNTDWLIFLSQNAVHHFFQQVCAEKISTKNYKGIVAIGPATYKQLQHHLSRNLLLPKEFSSQGILDMPGFQSPKGEHITIISGKNPKPILAKTLRARQANVIVTPCYQRVPIQYTTEELESIDFKTIHCIIVTSQESLNALHNSFSNTHFKNHLLEKTLCVISHDLHQHAKKLGFTHIIRADNATDEAVANTITSLHS